MKYLKLYLETDNIKPLEETLEEYVTSIFIQGVKGFEIVNEDILNLSFSRWEVIIIPSNEDITSIENFIFLSCKNLNIKIISSKVDEDTKDYLNQNEYRYSLDMGNFVIFNNEEDYNKFYSPTKIPIIIKQSTAFGTGQHETTALCLESIENFHNKGYNFKNILDLGCGSAILAIAMSKLFNGKILATDIDELALQKACEFILKNQAKDKIDVLLSIGFANIKEQKFDLIMANILLNPLLGMREDFYNYLATDGYLVLSGFLDAQVEKLLNSFNKKFKVVEIKERNSWRAIIFTK